MATGQGNHELVFLLPAAFQVASPELTDDGCRRVSDPGVTFSGQGLQSNEGGFLFKHSGFCNLPELKFLFLGGVGAEI